MAGKSKVPQKPVAVRGVRMEVQGEDTDKTLARAYIGLAKAVKAVA